MSLENIRVSELAKELGLSSKEVIEKFAQISITVKSHSNTVTPDQVKKIKDFIANGSKVVTKKPKAFVVKKAKTQDNQEFAKTNVEKTDSVQKVEKIERPKVERVVKSESAIKAKKLEDAETKAEVAMPKRPQVEIVKQPAPNRLEIVRRAPKPSDRPKRPQGERTDSKAPQTVFHSQQSRITGRLGKPCAL